MDACILVPKQFSLVLTLHPNPKNILEMCVAVWSNCFLNAGTSLYPDEGEIRYERLEVFTTLKESNIRYKFGCYDEITEVDDREVRHCNWVRFVKSSNNPEEVNMVGLVSDGQTVFRLVKDIKPNDEIVVYFQSSFIPDSPVKAKIVDKSVYDELEDKILEECTTNNLLIPSPTLRLDECLSGGNSVTSSSDDSLPPTSVELNKTPSPSSCNPNPPKRARERTWLPCEFCQKKFDRPSLLKRHMRTHTGEKPHVCDICKKAFSTSSSLNTHRRIHSGEKPHECHICGKKFTASSNLYYHRMTHNKDKPHKCTMCSKSFPTPGDLRSHMYVHNGSWPFKCDLCDRGFSKQTNLKNHMLLHSGDKPHVCQVCEKRFALQCNLKTHMKTHEDNRTSLPADDKHTSNENEARLKADGSDNHDSIHKPMEYKRTKLTDTNLERHIPDSNLYYTDKSSSFVSSPYSQYPYYCSTPKEKEHFSYSFSCFPVMPPIQSPSANPNHFLSANMMFPRHPTQHLPSSFPGMVL